MGSDSPPISISPKRGCHSGTGQVEPSRGAEAASGDTGELTNATMRRFVIKRLALMAVTLWVVSVMLFSLAEVLPGDVGATILGQFASRDQVAALDHQLGVDRPLPVRYASWIGNFATGDWGDSYLLRTPIRPLVLHRLGSSFLLAGIALVLIIPISISLGVLAAIRRGTLLDHAITSGGLAITVIPEFVSGSILLVIFAVLLGWFPVSAAIPAGSGPLEVIHHLFLPAVPLMFALFGYVGRMARAGTIEALESDYVRTAVLKGLPRRRVIWRHVLPNALPPTITVIGAQMGWLVGGLVVIETLFNYPGIGKLILDSAIGHDLPLLEDAVLVVAVIYMSSNLIADVIYALLNPRIRIES